MIWINTICEKYHLTCIMTNATCICHIWIMNGPLVVLTQGGSKKRHFPWWLSLFDLLQILRRGWKVYCAERVKFWWRSDIPVSTYSKWPDHFSKKPLSCATSKKDNAKSKLTNNTQRYIRVKRCNESSSIMSQQASDGIQGRSQGDGGTGGRPYRNIFLLSPPVPKYFFLCGFWRPF